ncbi:carboxylate--amine ligase [Halorussus halophilus]|uniref:carboxylate--amine ligase n=1 Tax=Halorussus halophilus TaxID=2650975 RepID=UPI001787FAF6|nr:ATP-grasp domain-containing protein [Halorussus halophilus]
MSGERVLVTDGQLRSGLAVVRSLGKRGAHVIAGESTRFATAFFSRHADERVVYPSPESDPDEFVSFLLNFLADNDVDALIPVGHQTTKLVSEHRDRFTELTDVPVTDYQRFRRGWDKAETFEAAKEADIPMPRTECPDSISEARAIADDIGFPVVVKARTSSGSRGLEFVETREEFDRAYRRVSESYPRPLVQERVPQSGSMYGAAFVYDEDTELHAQFACEFLREYPPSGGPSTFHESIGREDLLEYGSRLLETLEWQGVALVEFKLDPRDGEPKLMEVNPRLWSSLHLAVFSGVDFPWLVYQHARGEDLDTNLDYRADVQARYILPGDLLRLAAVHDREAVREFFPIFDPDVHYEIPHWDDAGPAVGRLLAMARFAASPSVWRKAILRN